MSRVVAALGEMGFRPVLSSESFVAYPRFDTVWGTCVLILDGGVPDIDEDQLIQNLDSNGVGLAEFWNCYEKTS